MTRNPVRSTQLKSVGYDPETSKLEIQFNSGAVYEYSDVPENTYKALVESPSIGTYFTDNIKWSFIYRKL